MSALLLLTLVLAQTAEPVDVSAVKSKLKALTDGRGLYIVYNSEDPSSHMLFSGDGKKLYQNRVSGGYRSAEQWNALFWDPRVPPTSSRPDVSMRDEGRVYELSCGKRTVPLTLVSEADLKPLIDGASFLAPRWTRRPERLMRDDAGNYFFVDRLRTEDSHDRRDFRVFRGPRGKMKQLPLKDIVDDSEGTIFATKDGTLRLISSSGSDRPVLKWIVGKKETPLTEVPLEDNARMIYIDLGPYSGQPLGTPCDGYL
jgi:hypothetical protein